MVSIQTHRRRLLSAFDLLDENVESFILGNRPNGARRSPVGPTEPATTTGRPALAAAERAISAASD